MNQPFLALSNSRLDRGEARTQILLTSGIQADTGHRGALRCYGIEKVRELPGGGHGSHDQALEEK